MPLRLRYALLLFITLPIGYAVRFSNLHLPHVVSKYGGSALWATAIYFLIAMLFPARTIPFRATTSMLVAFTIEFFKLVRTPALDAFRLTLPGKLLLGRYFSVADLLAYAIAIAAATLLDQVLFRTSSASAVR